MGRDIAADENNVEREHHGASEHDGVAAVQGAEAFWGTVRK